MLRVFVAALLVPAAISLNPQQKPDPAKPGEKCRTIATASRTHTTSPGVTMDTLTKCSFDGATNKSTCTSQFKDSRGIPTTNIAITSYASVDDVIDETKVVPPLRRSARTDATTKTNSSSTSSSIVNTYDAQKRLVREVGTGPTGVQYSTTYTSWDSKGRPTVGGTVHKGGRNNIAITYNDASRTQTMISTDQGKAVNCTATFDANGNPAATSCYGSVSGSKTVTTATERVCR